MTLVGQPPQSDALEAALEQFAHGDLDGAEATVRQAARQAKAEFGSGSPELARGYADMARFHFRAGQFERAAQEFQHAAKGPMPPDRPAREDRLAFLFGFGAALAADGQLADAETILRQCLAYARNLHGGQSAHAFVALVPLADVLLLQGKTADAARLANEAYDALWRLGDPMFVSAVGTRAEALKALGQTESPFPDLNDLPEEMVAAAVSTTLTRAGLGDPARVRAVFADLLRFVDGKYGHDHPLTRDAVAAMAHHEGAVAGDADDAVHRTAVRRAVWSYAVGRLPGGLIANLDVRVEGDGTVHLAPHLTRDASQDELDLIERTLTDAVDDLFARPAAPA